MKYLIIFLLAGCTNSKVSEDTYGPDPYDVYCIDGKVWIISNHGAKQFNWDCKEND